MASCRTHEWNLADTYTSRLVKRAGERPWFQLLTLALVAMRVFVLPGASHAFDAGAMASHAQRLFIIGSSPFMHVVKSPLFFGSRDIPQIAFVAT